MESRRWGFVINHRNKTLPKRWASCFGWIDGGEALSVSDDVGKRGVAKSRQYYPRRFSWPSCRLLRSRKLCSYTHVLLHVQDESDLIPKCAGIGNYFSFISIEIGSFISIFDVSLIVWGSSSPRFQMGVVPNLTSLGMNSWNCYKTEETRAIMYCSSRAAACDLRCFSYRGRKTGMKKRKLDNTQSTSLWGKEPRTAITWRRRD